jgi:hypothetical protein
MFAMRHLLIGRVFLSDFLFFYNYIGVVSLDSICSAISKCRNFRGSYALILLIKKHFLMRHLENVTNNVTPTNQTTIALDSIKQELQESYPLLKRLKVKRFYNTGRVKATACIGKRKIRITGSLFNVIEKFTQEYQDRLPTAFTNLNTI